MNDSDTLRQAIEFLKDRSMPDVKMTDIPRLHQWWQRLHEMAAQALTRETTAENAIHPTVDVTPV